MTMDGSSLWVYDRSTSNMNTAVRYFIIKMSKNWKDEKIHFILLTWFSCAKTSETIDS